MKVSNNFLPFSRQFKYLLERHMRNSLLPIKVKALLAPQISSLLLLLVALGCSPAVPGPDKTIAGAGLGAGWGAGTGTIIGNQVSHPGTGLAIGAGLGLVNGAITGSAFDAADEELLKQREELASLSLQNQINRANLMDIQDKLDSNLDNGAGSLVTHIYFDDDATSLKAGSAANLEVFANSVKRNPQARIVNVIGNTDDTGNLEYNKRLAEARARTVSGILISHGVSSDQIKVESFGSERPLASNSTSIGRQLNRRVDLYITP